MYWWMPANPITWPLPRVLAASAPPTPNLFQAYLKKTSCKTPGSCYLLPPPKTPAANFLRGRLAIGTQGCNLATFCKQRPASPDGGGNKRVWLTAENYALQTLFLRPQNKPDSVQAVVGCFYDSCKPIKFRNLPLCFTIT